MLKNIIGVFCFFILSVVIVNAQNAQNQNITENENILISLFAKLNEEKNDSIKELINSNIRKVFLETLAINESFNYSFAALNKISILVSTDKKVKVYNWNVPMQNGTYKYFAFVQFLQQKKKPAIVYELTDKSADIENAEQADLNYSNWFGALYYQIIVTKEGKNIYYTLLGWDGNNDFSNKKIIEVMTFDQKGAPRFGYPFKYEKKRTKRVIFEYSEKALMSLKYNEDLKMIVYDHLSPSDPKFVGQFQFYGPDFSYDALGFKKGKWVYFPDVDARNPKERGNNRKLDYGY